MKQIASAALGAIAGLSIAASAYADGRPTMKTICDKFLCVFDARGTMVGVPGGAVQLERQIGNDWYVLGVEKTIKPGDPFPETRLQINILLYYTTANCTGQPYFLNDQMMAYAKYDGSSFWVPDIRGTAYIEYDSYAYGTPLYCSGPLSSPNEAYLQPAVKSETRTFYAPLKVQ